MNIPDEVMKEAFGEVVFYEPYYSIHSHQADVIAEWARREAFRDVYVYLQNVGEYSAAEGIEADLIGPENE